MALMTERARFTSVIYQEALPISRVTASQIFNNASSDDLITNALLRLTLHDPDWQWVLNKCIEFTAYDSKQVQRIAIQCIGHLARIHNQLDLSVVLPLLAKLRQDPALANVTEDTLDDISVFMGSR